MFVIYCAEDQGWVWNSPIEGWVFTTLYSKATRFKTRKEAEQAIKDHYNPRGLVIEPAND